MKRKPCQDVTIRYFSADGVELESFRDLAGPRIDEYLDKIVIALAKKAAREDFEKPLKKKRRKRVLTPPGKGSP